MQSRKLGLGLTVVAVAVAVALFFVLRDDEAESPTVQSQSTTEKPSNGDSGGGREPDKPDEPEVPTIVVRGGQPVDGVAELEFQKGERIRFTVESDVADHVHLHGYDVFQHVAAGGTASFDVPATIDGVFEVELEDRAIPLAEITVQP